MHKDQARIITFYSAQGTYTALEAARLLVFQSMHDEGVPPLEHQATLVTCVFCLRSSCWVSLQCILLQSLWLVCNRLRFLC